MICRRCLAALLLMLPPSASLLAQSPGQSAVWAYLTDKGPEAHARLKAPAELLSSAALARRAQHGIPLTVKDLPVYRPYLDSLRRRGQLVFASRWMNAVALVPAGPANSLAELPFVKHVRPIRPYEVRTTRRQTTSMFNYGTAEAQLQQLNLPALHDNGATGQGVRIGIFDSGFNNLDNLPGFSSLLNAGRLIATVDEYKQAPVDFTEDTHGTQVCGTIFGDLSGQYLGAAFDAEALLARTETVSAELRLEEVRWQAAMEWADSVGVDIINTSLIYNFGHDDPAEDYDTTDMDGNTSLISQAADEAAQRGILVVCSAGNDGSIGFWGGKIGTPCDADSVLCVGATDDSGGPVPFSSEGPTADGRLKPEVVARGVNTATLNPGGGLQSLNGTSFSAPLISGLAACLLSKHPQAGPMELREAIMASGDRHNNPGNKLGHGVPDAMAAEATLAQVLDRQPPKPERDIHLGPNPARRQLNLSVMTDSFARYDARLISLQGKVVRRWNNLSTNVRFPLPVAQLSGGMYVLVLSGRDWTAERKLFLLGNPN